MLGVKCTEQIKYLTKINEREGISPFLWLTVGYFKLVYVFPPPGFY